MQGRAPRFHEKVSAQFVSPQNVAYLAKQLGKSQATIRRHALSPEWSAMMRETLLSDPHAMRARARGGATFWGEVRRLNALFVSEHTTPRPDDMDISRRIFEKTVLRPPGREKLNGPGPLWAERERQKTWGGAGGAAGGDGGTAGSRGATIAEARAAYSGLLPDNPYNVSPTARGHIDNKLIGLTLTSPAFDEVSSADPEGDLMGDVWAWGDTWHRNGGAEFERWRGIPVWQKGGRRPHDATAVEEGLGLGDREHGNFFRKYDMSLARAGSTRPGGGRGGIDWGAVATAGSQGAPIGTSSHGITAKSYDLSGRATPALHGGSQSGYPV
jgi:hypothetical protein